MSPSIQQYALENFRNSNLHVVQNKGSNCCSWLDCKHDSPGTQSKTMLCTPPVAAFGNSLPSVYHL